MVVATDLSKVKSAGERRRGKRKMREGGKQEKREEKESRNTFFRTAEATVFLARLSARSSLKPQTQML